MSSFEGNLTMLSKKQVLEKYGLGFDKNWKNHEISKLIAANDWTFTRSLSLTDQVLYRDNVVDEDLKSELLSINEQLESINLKDCSAKLLHRIGVFCPNVREVIVSIKEEDELNCNAIMELFPNMCLLRLTTKRIKIQSDLEIFSHKNLKEVDIKGGDFGEEQVRAYVRGCEKAENISIESNVYYTLNVNELVPFRETLQALRLSGAKFQIGSNFQKPSPSARRSILLGLSSLTKEANVFLGKYFPDLNLLSIRGDKPNCNTELSELVLDLRLISEVFPNLHTLRCKNATLQSSTELQTEHQRLKYLYFQSTWFSQSSLSTLSWFTNLVKILLDKFNVVEEINSKYTVNVHLENLEKLEEFMLNYEAPKSSSDTYHITLQDNNGNTIDESHQAIKDKTIIFTVNCRVKCYSLFDN